MSLVETTARAIAPLAWAALGTGDTLAQLNRRKASLRHAELALSSLGIPFDQLAALASGKAWIANADFTCAWIIGKPDRKELTT